MSIIKRSWLPAALAALILGAAVGADDWPQWLGPQRDGVWREGGILAKFPEKGPKLLWRAKVALGLLEQGVESRDLVGADPVIQSFPPHQRVAL